MPAPRYRKKETIERFARKADTIEGLSVEMALASLYNEKTGVAVASRAQLAKMTHYTEKRVRTQIARLRKSGRWQVIDNGNFAKTFIPARGAR